MNTITKENKIKFNFGRWYNKYGVAVILVVIFITASLLSPNFLTVENLTNVLRQIVVVSIIGLGATFILVSAQINVAYDGLIALFGCTACLVMRATQNLFLAVIATVALAVVEGLIFGLCVTKLMMPAFIVSLAINTIAAGSILIVTNGHPIDGLGNFNIIGQGYIGPVPISVILLFLLLILSWFIMKRTCFGRYVFAAGGNRSAAIASGINVNKVLLKVYVLDAIMTAVGGIVFMSRINSGQPSAGSGYAFDAITGVVVGGSSIYGGAGSAFGTLLGCAIVGIVNNLMNLMNVHSYWQQIAKGLIIMFAVCIDIQTKRAASKVRG